MECSSSDTAFEWGPRKRQKLETDHLSSVNNATAWSTPVLGAAVHAVETNRLDLAIGSHCDLVNGKDEINKVNGATDVCFGMLTNIRISSDRGKLASYASILMPVSLHGDLVTLESDKTSTLGSISAAAAHALNSLDAHDEIELQLYTKPSSKPTQKSRDDNILCAIIYGPETLSEATGEFLDQFDLFLQYPRHCTRDLRYRNPQRLNEQYVDRLQDAEILQHRQVIPNAVELLVDLETNEQIERSDTPSALKTPLHDHQKQALTFMLRRERGWMLHENQADLWKCERMSNGLEIYRNTITDEISYNQPPDFRGGILADQMGLGKSLSMIALIASDKDQPSGGFHVGNELPDRKATLLIVRSSLLEMWINQIRTHVCKGKLTWTLHHGKKRINETFDLSSTDIVITTYRTLMGEWRKHNDLHPQIIFTSRWRRVILDEAHDIRDCTTVTAKAMCALEATSRWALTGTPIPNRLSDLASLYKYLRLYPYDDAKTFHDLVAKLCYGSEQRTEKLVELFKYTMLRRSIKIIRLPQRNDILSELEFNPDEQARYDQVRNRESHIRKCLSEQETGTDMINVLSWINKLLMICSLGTLVKPSQLDESSRDLFGRVAWDGEKAQSMFNTLAITASATCSHCGVDLSTVATEAADHSTGDQHRPRMSRCQKLTCGNCLEKKGTTTCEHQPTCPSAAVSTLSSSVGADNSILDDSAFLTESQIPTKIRALLQDIRTHVTDEKCVVFSLWTTTLDCIEKVLRRNGIECVRIDGNVPAKKRDLMLNRFREETAIRVALLTISCGAVGLDLTAASRAYLMEPHWNPSVEEQALARVYRMGQKRTVTTTRYVIRNTFEEYVRKVQNCKQLLSEIILSNNPSNREDSLSKIQVFETSMRSYTRMSADPGCGSSSGDFWHDRPTYISAFLERIPMGLKQRTEGPASAPLTP